MQSLTTYHEKRRSFEHEESGCPLLVWSVVGMRSFAPPPPARGDAVRCGEAACHKTPKGPGKPLLQQGQALRMAQSQAVSYRSERGMVGGQKRHLDIGAKWRDRDITTGS